MVKSAQIIGFASAFKNVMISSGNMNVVFEINYDSIPWTLATTFASTSDFSGGIQPDEDE